MRLWPLTAAELRRLPASRLLDWAIGPAPDVDRIRLEDAPQREGYVDALLRGGYPGICSLGPAERRAALLGLPDSFADRDARDCMALRKPKRLRDLMAHLAQQTAGTLNVAALARSIGIDWLTADQYLYALERLGAASKLPPWRTLDFPEESRRTKRHFVDTGLACALRGLDAEFFNLDEGMLALGPLLETFAFQQLQRAVPLQENLYDLHHWRSRYKEEIDILACASIAVVGFKVKATQSFRKSDFAHMDAFERKGLAGGREFTGIVLHLGDAAHRFGKGRRFALPLSALWSRIEGLSESAH